MTIEIFDTVMSGIGWFGIFVFVISIFYLIAKISFLVKAGSMCEDFGRAARDYAEAQLKRAKNERIHYEYRDRLYKQYMEEIDKEEDFDLPFPEVDDRR